MKSSRDIIKAVFSTNGSDVPGITFGEGKVNDFCWGGPGDPHGYSQKRWNEGNYEYYDDRFGNIWKRINTADACKVGEIDVPALNDWSDLDKLKMPEYDRTTAAENYKKGFAASPEKFKVAGMSGWIFADARYLRRMDNYLMDMALYPEELHKLHKMLGAIYENLILAAADADADAMIFCEDLGTQQGLLFSPAMWDEYFKELYCRLFGIAHEHGIKVIMHSCGQNRAVIERLLESGVDCFQFDQPRVYDFADLSALLKKYSAVLWSPVDIQKVLPTGNRSLIEQDVDAMMRAFGGKIIFKEYPDLVGIGVNPEWNNWSYERILSYRQIH
jgi:uroporphyrinogen decarboxylase